MRKYAQPKTAKPAPRDASLSLRLQKLQDAVATLQGDLQLAVESGILPSGWTVTQSTETSLDVTQCGSGTLTAIATCGNLISTRDVSVNVAITPEITVTPTILPDGWAYNSATGELTLNSNDTGTLSISADNGGGFISTQSIDVTSSVSGACPVGVQLTTAEVFSDFNPITDPNYYGDWPGDLYFTGEYDVSGMSSGWGDVGVAIPIPGCGTLNATFRIHFMT